MAETLPELAVHEYQDPDAQATISDFVDYTEFFPSDLIRSLTLIGSLDQAYQQDAQTIHELTKTYGCLPTLPANERPEPRVVRKEISETLDHAIRCRESTFAEATRLCDNANRLFDRLTSIKKKLLAMPKPPSRDPTPLPQSPTLNRSKRMDTSRTSFFSYYANANRAGGASSRNRPKRLSNHIITPGQVLPPLEIGSAGLSETSDYESESSDVPVTASHSLINRKHKSGLQKVRKSLKGDKIKVAKPPKIRMPGAMGTNVHSVVAGISTSNAIALLEKPPEDAKLGSRHLPWLKLTEYEMAMLRKKMKKNAIWHPSPTMVRRELTNRGRGLESYKKAKQHAEATGEPLIDEDPSTADITAHDPNDLTQDAPDLSITNRGMLLNEAKRLKRESLMKEQAARDAMEIEETGRKIAYASEFLASLFNPPQQSPESQKTSKKRKSGRAQATDPASGSTPIPSKKIKLSLATATTKIPLAPAGVAKTPASHVKEKTPTLRLHHTAPSKTRTENSTPPIITTKDETPEDGATPTRRSRRQSMSGPVQGLKIKLRPSSSTEPPSRKASLRNSSNSSSNLSSPMDLNPPPRVAPPKRSKRPDPVLARAGASTGPRRILKRSGGSNKQEDEDLAAVEPDDVDPDEPRYCICGGVSWGDMVGCDNDSCEMEWFHWGCVGLSESPARREKWYCPNCQKSLSVDVQGNAMKKQKGRR